MKFLMLSLASFLKSSSLPVFLMLSPQQLSLSPKIPNFTPALFSIVAVAWATLLIRGS